MEREREGGEKEGEGEGERGELSLSQVDFPRMETLTQAQDVYY